MLGFITTRDLVLHGALIVHEFGVTCYLRCLRRTLFSGRQVTFLECVST